jgi:hypothetical protein
MKFVRSIVDSTPLVIFSMLILSGINVLFITGIIPASYAHLDHLPHYNSGGNRYSWGNYSYFIALEPEYGVAKQQPTAIEFSIQDRNGNDVYNVTTMVEIYETTTGQRIHVFPWTFQKIGDFILFYIFPRIGNYQIVLSILEDNKDGTTASLSNLIGNADPPRTLLSNVKDCQCERTVFNISISPTFGFVQNLMFAVIIILPVTVLGSVLVWKYRSLQSKIGIGKGMQVVLTRREAVRYLVMLLAIGGGALHLAVFQDHATQHVYYSLFLLAAAASQVAYGIIFVLVTLSADRVSQDAEMKRDAEMRGAYGKMDKTEEKRKKIIHNYKRNMIVNMFGLIGTSVLIGLYVYSVIFPPPLSPTNSAEQVDIGGISAKLLEILLVIGIIFIIRWDREEIKDNLIQTSNA